ncbi:hypothetical protein SASPL_101168 [Salvia splendens]|uniref:Auxin responsive GH3 protein family n=1 Tax=Salvia splendens TaxID=180675 RepID=A0A8X8YTH8_SALSN|nr:hypothetical protein SASPL_101168 [Salvia splendens]
MPTRHVKDLDEGKSLRFMFIKPDSRTQGGLVARSAITRYFKNDVKNRPDAMTTTSMYEAVYCEDIFQSMYTQMLCGLYDREQVLRVGALFALGLLRAIRFLQLNWQQLTHDIARPESGRSRDLRMHGLGATTRARAGRLAGAGMRQGFGPTPNLLTP